MHVALAVRGAGCVRVCWLPSLTNTDKLQLHEDPWLMYLTGAAVLWGASMTCAGGTNTKMQSLFQTMLNTVMGYDPVGYGVPYSHLTFPDTDRERAAEYCAQLIAVLVNYSSKAAEPRTTHAVTAVTSSTDLTAHDMTEAVHPDHTAADRASPPPGSMHALRRGCDRRSVDGGHGQRAAGVAVWAARGGAHGCAAAGNHPTAQQPARADLAPKLAEIHPHVPRCVRGA